MYGKFEIKYIIIFLLSLTFLAFQIENRLTPSQERGKLIYTKGERASGEPITTMLSGATFDAKILPCVNCHGKRGEGNPEGGVDPSPLDWSTMTKPYVVEFKNGRKRTGYDHETLKLAIGEGIDPSGNELDMVMPRYTLTDQDVDDLISYLKIIDVEEIEGVTDTSIILGVILPSKDRYAGRSEAIVKTMKAFLDIINDRGGLYSRKFYLHEFYAEDAEELSPDSLTKFLESNEIFAFVGSDHEGMTTTALEILEEKKIPVIGLISGEPKKDDYLKNNFYYLFSGLEKEIEKLIDFALIDLEAAHEKLAIFYDSKSSLINADITDFLSLDNHLRIDVSAEGFNMSRVMETLKMEGIKNCLFLGNAIQSRYFLESVSTTKWYPNVLIPSKLASPSWFEASAAMNEKIYFSFPTWNSTRTDKAMQQYRVMASTYNLDQVYLNAQLNGVSAAILFTEVLKLAGRDISRESMIDILHQQKNFKTGFIAPLSFGPNDRIGSDEIFIVRANLTDKVLDLAN